MRGISILSKASTALIILMLALTGCKHEPDMSDLPNIILICIESVRADHLGCYGYDRDTSPVIDSLAASGTLWNRCQSHSPATLSSFASIWTGLSPAAHRTGLYDGSLHELDFSLPTIASALQSRGYQTVGIMRGGITGRRFGFDKGFDVFGISIENNDRTSNAMTKILDWLGSRRISEDRFLIIMHCFDPHPPYDPLEPCRSMWTDSTSDSLTGWWSLVGDSLLNPGEVELLTGLYDGEIRSVDDQIGILCAYLRSSGLADSTVIIITSDHGEEFLDHGWIGHSHTLHQELLHVPLIISGPGVPVGERRDCAVGLWDIFPTITALAGVETPMNVEGMNLLSDSLPDERPIPSGAIFPNMYAVDEAGKLLLLPQESVAITLGDLKLIWDVVADSMTMYDLAADPLEMTPLAPEEELILEIERYSSTPPQCMPRPILDEPLREPGFLRFH